MVGTGRHQAAAERGRARKPDKGPPRWQRELGRGSAQTTFIVGALLTLPGASYLAGLSRIDKLNYSTAETVVLVGRIQPGHAGAAGGPAALLRDRPGLDRRSDRPSEGMDRAASAAIRSGGAYCARRAALDQGRDRALELTAVRPLHRHGWRSPDQDDRSPTSPGRSLRNVRVADWKPTVVLPHLPVAERGRARQGCAGGGAALEPRHVRGHGDPPGSGRAARAPGTDAGAGSCADPRRPDAGLALHRLSRGGDDHGPRLGRDPALWAARAELR
jgi:hypothetical protein